MIRLSESTQKVNEKVELKNSASLHCKDALSQSRHNNTKVVTHSGITYRKSSDMRKQILISGLKYSLFRPVEQTPQTFFHLVLKCEKCNHITNH